ncbi:MAG: VanZ family protein [Betaproteobacteria bacterium]|nr:MAG: VanZ family protein [Betaproteobacteria bacterium]
MWRTPHRTSLCRADCNPEDGGVTASSLPRFLLAAYVLLIAYASLYPLTGWHAHGASPLAFVTAPWPRWITGFDIAANLFGYWPLGLLCALSWVPRHGARRALAAAVLCGALLSLALEAAQSYLPARVASNVDWLVNIAGALLGAGAGVLAAPWLLGTGPVRRLRAQALSAGLYADLGLTLIALWLFAQLNPATLLFGTGDLRDLLAEAAGPAYAAELFVTVETLTAAANLVAVSLLASAMMRPAAPVRRLLLALLAAALAVKALAFAILMRAEHALAWLTPGAQQGLAIGIAVMLAAVALPRVLRLALAAVLLMAASVLVNLSPPNPYTAATLKVWTQGHFLNFNGLTQFVSALWPFAALLYLIALAARRERE